MRSHGNERWGRFLALATATALGSAGCEVFVDFDRTKIEIDAMDASFTAAGGGDSGAVGTVDSADAARDVATDAADDGADGTSDAADGADGTVDADDSG